MDLKGAAAECRFAVISPEQQPGQQQRAAKPGVEHGDKAFRCKPAGPQSDAQRHHRRHDGEGFCVKEFPKEVLLFPVRRDAGGVLFDQPAEHKGLKQRKNQRAQKEIHRRPVRRIGRKPNAKDVEPGCAPNKTGEQQQGVAFYFHVLPLW